MASEDWNRFFVAAGVPDGVTANYAHIFKTNRIKKEMLLDLTKEYLQDMGISVMGDIISILKQAKITYEKDVRGKMLIDEMDHYPIPQASVLNRVTVASSVSKPSEAARKITPDKPRIVAVRPKPPLSAPVPIVQKTVAPSRPASTVVVASVAAKRKAPVEIEEIEPEGPELPTGLSQVPKKRVKVIVSKSPSVIATRTPPVNTSSTSLISDRMYSARMVEVTEKNKKIVQAKAAAQAVQRAKKSTVFDRLGEGHVSSTTVDVEEIAVKRKKASETVFDRLGGLTLKPSSPATATSKIIKTNDRPLVQSPVKLRRPDIAVSTTRQLVTSVKGKRASQVLTHRLPSARTVSAVPKMASDRLELSARDRLGRTSLGTGSPRKQERIVAVASSKKSVFSRLGR